MGLTAENNIAIRSSGKNKIPLSEVNKRMGIK